MVGADQERIESKSERNGLGIQTRSWLCSTEVLPWVHEGLVGSIDGFWFSYPRVFVSVCVCEVPLACEGHPEARMWLPPEQWTSYRRMCVCAACVSSLSLPGIRVYQILVALLPGFQGAF